MLFPSLAIPFELPAVPTAYLKWVWVAVILLAVLAVVARLLNWIATFFEHCPHCEKVVRVGQRVCHHCFKAVKKKPPSPRATRPLNAGPPSGRLSNS